MIAWISGDVPFPPIDRALDEPNGLLAAGGDLSTGRLLAAYRQGIFPWYSEGQPILWWSPDPRMVLYLADFAISRSLRRRIRQHTFELRSDTAFRSVIECCAQAPRAGQFGTWITPPMVSAYSELHRAGYAHSIETWRRGELVGGLYGLSLGGVFFGESMFALETDASKVALAGLVALLRTRNGVLIDCQQETAHLASFGARPISRRAFAAELGKLVNWDAFPARWPRGLLPDPS